MNKQTKPVIDYYTHPNYLPQLKEKENLYIKPLEAKLQAEEREKHIQDSAQNEEIKLQFPRT